MIMAIVILFALFHISIHQGRRLLSIAMNQGRTQWIWWKWECLVVSSHDGRWRIHDRLRNACGGRVKSMLWMMMSVVESIHEEMKNL